MNYSVLGKTIENLLKRVNVTLNNDPKKTFKTCFKTNFYQLQDI